MAMVDAEAAAPPPNPASRLIPEHWKQTHQRHVQDYASFQQPAALEKSSAESQRLHSLWLAQKARERENAKAKAAQAAASANGYPRTTPPSQSVKVKQEPGKRKSTTSNHGVAKAPRPQRPVYSYPNPLEYPLDALRVFLPASNAKLPILDPSTLDSNLSEPTAQPFYPEPPPSTASRGSSHPSPRTPQATPPPRQQCTLPIQPSSAQYRQPPAPPPIMASTPGYGYPTSSSSGYAACSSTFPSDYASALTHPSTMHPGVSYPSVLPPVGYHQYPGTGYYPSPGQPTPSAAPLPPQQHQQLYLANGSGGVYGAHMFASQSQPGAY